MEVLVCELLLPSSGRGSTFRRSHGLATLYGVKKPYLRFGGAARLALIAAWRRIYDDGADVRAWAQVL